MAPRVGDFSGCTGNRKSIQKICGQVQIYRHFEDHPDRLKEIDDQDLRTKLDKVTLEMEVQNSRLEELELKMRQDRRVLEAQNRRTREEIESAELHLQQVRGEY